MLFYLIKLNRSKETIKINVSEDEVEQYMWVSNDELYDAINGIGQIDEIKGVYPN